jgi:hypothetical protein
LCQSNKNESVLVVGVYTFWTSDYVSITKLILYQI